VEQFNRAKDTAETKDTMQFIKDAMEIKVDEAAIGKVAALKTAMKKLSTRYRCNAVAIQCWNALQAEIGIMPCAANSLLTGEGIPVVCETDIHGAVTSLLMKAASLDTEDIMFADWTVRHPDNENGELLQHCGPWPLSVAKAKPALSKPLVFDHPGAVSAEAKPGLLTLSRFDGDSGEYSLLLGNAKGIDGPYTLGTYLWIEVENWKRLEAKIVEGPYIHHCVAIHGDYVPVLYEACKYLGIRPDLYDNNEEEVKAYLRGE
jgi:L-fucose isomerase-like protein